MIFKPQQVIFKPQLVSFPLDCGTLRFRVLFDESIGPFSDIAEFQIFDTAPSEARLNSPPKHQSTDVSPVLKIGDPPKNGRLPCCFPSKAIKMNMQEGLEHSQDMR